MDAMTRRMRFSTGEGTVVKNQTRTAKGIKAKGNLCHSRTRVILDKHIDFASSIICHMLK